MSEASMWGMVRKMLKGMDPIRIENRCELGTPDVNLANGVFIELKWERHAPKRSGAFAIKHYTQEQRVWAIRRAHAGGRVYLLLKIGPEYLIFRGEVAAQFLNYSTLELLRKVAIQTWKRKINANELRTILS